MPAEAGSALAGEGDDDGDGCVDIIALPAAAARVDSNPAADTMSLLDTNGEKYCPAAKIGFGLPGG